MIEIKAAKEIRGTVEVPPSIDLAVLAASIALASRVPVTINPVPDTPISRWWISILKDHLSITSDSGSWRCEPVEQPAHIHFPHSRMPYRDFVIPLFWGLGKSVAFESVSAQRIERWQQIISRAGITVETVQEAGTTVIRASDAPLSPLPTDLLTTEEIVPLLGLAVGRGVPFQVHSPTPFSDPLRPLLAAMGYDFAVHSTVQVETDPIKKRLKFLQKGRKSEEPPVYSISADFSRRPDKEATITLPGDPLLVSLLIAAKSLVQKGNLIIANAPLESWANHTLDMVRKMGCRPGIQESGKTSFGETGLIQLQSFTLTNRKVVCAPTHQFIEHLPAMVVIASFGQGQSVFRGIEDLRRDEPDTIEQLVSYLARLGARHGEMPDGVVVEGAKQFDGFDSPQALSASIDGAFAVAGLKCIGTTSIPEERILERWPGFREILESVCDFRA